MRSSQWSNMIIRHKMCTIYVIYCTELCFNGCWKDGCVQSGTVLHDHNRDDYGNHRFSALAKWILKMRKPVLRRSKWQILVWSVEVEWFNVAPTNYINLERKQINCMHARNLKLGINTLHWAATFTRLWVYIPKKTVCRAQHKVNLHWLLTPLDFINKCRWRNSEHRKLWICDRFSLINKIIIK